ncbi:MAG: hypothetical protein HYU78_01330 [Rhodocyclales bacterium]|nr:hypothetical protein [Rhodocyclales bacterium]
MNRSHEAAQSMLSACRNVGELRSALESLCAEFGSVLNVTLMCGHGSSQKKLCVVDLIPGDSDVQNCAQRLGGRVFGYSAVILDILPHPDFGCPRGVSGSQQRECSCVAKA